MENPQESKPEFGKIRSFFWPIYSDELKKFLPMGMLMFFILMNYSLLRITKDSLVVPEVGPEAIPWLKGTLVIASSIIFVLIYTKLVNILSRETNFYLIIFFFISFFAAFGYVLYPSLTAIHPDPASISALQESYPRLSPVFAIYGVWLYAVVYVLAELWGSVMIALLFWQFANEITRTREAKRFYAMFGLLANFALLATWVFTLYVDKFVRPTVPANVDEWGVVLIYYMSLVALSGFIIMGIYRWMNTNVLTDSKYYDAAETSDKKKSKKPKLSVWESLVYICSSKYLGFIALLIIGYGISINLVELVWKSQLQEQFPLKADYSAMMGWIQGLTGISTIILILLLKGIVQRVGWFTAAIITPIMILVTGMLLFGFVSYRDEMAPLALFFGTTPLWMAVLLGSAQQILSKGTKYSLFDPTKEMTYIPLDQESKIKGKAAVDVIGGRLGKASGGYISIGVLFVTGWAVSEVALILAAIVILVIGLWLLAAKGLNSMYTALRKAKKEMDTAKQQQAALEKK
ncbi:MAG: Npt1/Npt2 family nucleotide transporter [Pseudomonadota bacterium]